MVLYLHLGNLSVSACVLSQNSNVFQFFLHLATESRILVLECSQVFDDVTVSRPVERCSTEIGVLLVSAGVVRVLLEGVGFDLLDLPQVLLSFPLGLDLGSGLTVLARVGAVLLVLQQVGILPQVWDDIEMSLLSLGLLQLLSVVLVKYDDPVSMVLFLLYRVRDDSQEPNKKYGKDCYAGEYSIDQRDPTARIRLVLKIHPCWSQVWLVTGASQLSGLNVISWKVVRR